jgi:hypothetical protein
MFPKVKLAFHCTLVHLVWYLSQFLPLGQCHLVGACSRISHVEEGETYPDRLCSSDEAIFHVCGTVKK